MVTSCPPRATRAGPAVRFVANVGGRSPRRLRTCRATVTANPTPARRSPPCWSCGRPASTATAPPHGPGRDRPLGSAGRAGATGATGPPGPPGPPGTAGDRRPEQRGVVVAEHADVPPEILAAVRERCLALPEVAEETAWAGT